ncbi:MAG: hypothetical protein IPP88_22590 [Betaproteobacteria bacterium]|nr:hypothetical protein [Betaproteobacteria bacterium]
MENFSHLEKHSWFGRFSTPDNSLTFPGALTYSLTDGACVKWVGEFPPFSLYGANQFNALLDEGIRCVLLGTQKAGIFSGFGGMRGDVTFGKGYPQAVFFCGDANDLAGLSGFRISITQFGEFCFPQGFKSQAPGAGFEVQPFSVGDREFSVLRVTQYIPAFDDAIASNLYAVDKASGKEVAITVSRADNCDDDFFLHIRQDVQWVIIEEYSTPQNAQRVIEDIRELLSLVSYLLQRPVAPIEIRAFIEQQDSAPRDLPVLLTRLMHAAGLDDATKQISAHHLPLRISDLNFQFAFTRWTANSQKNLFRYFVNRIASQSGLVGPHDAYSRVILLCVLLEDVNANSGGATSEKYTKAVKDWAFVTTKERLLKTAAVKTLEEFGTLLSDLRNELAHSGRPRRVTLELDSWQMLEICDILEVVLYSYSLSILGVDSQIAIDAQLHLCKCEEG